MKKYLLLFFFCLCALAVLIWSGVPREKALIKSATADRILIEKSSHTLTLFKNDQPLKTYPVSLGRGGLQAKTKEGDALTPEGIYKIDRRNPNSRYYLSLGIDYPDAKDRARAEKNGVNPGGDIMIHGLMNGMGFVGTWHRLVDWTQGCIALTDQEMEEIWNAVPDGTIVEIRP
jgi:murein L,D-transpeptidase YafK